MIEENQGEPLPFGQLLITVHVGLSGGKLFSNNKDGHRLTEVIQT
jgi:hypothetical protein